MEDAISQLYQTLGESEAPRENSSVDPIDELYKQFGQVDPSRQILAKPTRVTQEFGNNNPGVEVFSNGFNSGTDLSADIGTDVNLPPGQWQVVDSYGEDKTPGHIGDGTNKGYGNSVFVQNTKTGEKMRMSHLSEVKVKPGQMLRGGTIGKSGDTGNASGPHVDLEYYTPDGKLGNVLQSPYAGYLPVIR